LRRLHALRWSDITTIGLTLPSRVIQHFGIGSFAALRRFRRRANYQEIVSPSP
jgi:hypothetical protein